MVLRSKSCYNWVNFNKISLLRYYLTQQPMKNYSISTTFQKRKKKNIERLIKVVRREKDVSSFN